MNDYWCCRMIGSRFVSPVNWEDLGKPGKSPGGAIPCHCHGGHTTCDRPYNMIDEFLLIYCRPIRRYLCSPFDSDRFELSDGRLEAFFFCDECNRRLRDQ